MELSQEEKSLFAKSKSTGDRPANVTQHGRYTFMLDTWKIFRGRTALVDIHNFVVQQAQENVVMQDGVERLDKPHTVGSRVGAAMKFSNDDAGTMARQNATKFLLSLFNWRDEDLTEEQKISVWERGTNDDPKKFTDDYLTEVGPDGTEQRVVVDGQPVLIPATNPMRGMLIGCDTAPCFTKTSKKWIILLNWIHIAAPGEGVNSYAEAAKRWAAFEAKLKG